MPYQAVFERYEMEYMVNYEQKEGLLRAMAPYMTLDRYGPEAIRDIYFDTDTYRLIRRSIEKPVYEENFRIRSDCQVTPDSMVFIELKKKFQKIVYKRCLVLPEKQAMQWVREEAESGLDSQIFREIDYFRRYYGTLRPVVFLSYEREAYHCTQGGSFRVIFDESILCRQEELSLTSEVWGTPLLPEGTSLMKIKCSGGIPMWMARVLSENKVYITTFSKYGTAYRKRIVPSMIKGGTVYAGHCFSRPV